MQSSTCTTRLGSPEYADWAASNSHTRLGLPRVIMDMLDIPIANKEAIIEAMKGVSEARKAGYEYDLSAAIKAGRGAKALIDDYTPQAEVMYWTMKSGASLGNAMTAVNQ